MMTGHVHSRPLDGILQAALISGALMICALLYAAILAAGERMDDYRIGGHGQANIQYPAWFKDSLLDLRDDLDDARTAGKRGVILFLSQKYCSHCNAFIETTLSDPATQSRVRKGYDVVALDIFSDLELTDIDGSASSIKMFADKQRARLTPTLLFYGVEDARLLKIVGFYPPEKFNRVLDYIDGGHYERQTLGQYLKRFQAETGGHPRKVVFDYTLFEKPPYLLDRSKINAERPLLVVFESPGCDPCARFHERVLGDAEVREQMRSFDAIQLDATDDSMRLIGPRGRRLTPRKWSEELQLAYDISVVFFDEQGNEIHRLDAETGRDRMHGSLQYVLEKAYQRHEQFLRWRKENALKKQQGADQG